MTKRSPEQIEDAFFEIALSREPTEQEEIDFADEIWISGSSMNIDLRLDACQNLRVLDLNLNSIEADIWEEIANNLAVIPSERFKALYIKTDTIEFVSLEILAQSILACQRSTVV